MPPLADYMIMYTKKQWNKQNNDDISKNLISCYTQDKCIKSTVFFSTVKLLK